jgi:hypothetical protein
MAPACFVEAGLEVAEACEFALEQQMHLADGTMALLGDDHFGLVVGLFAALHPSDMAFGVAFHGFVGAVLGLGALQVVLLAIDEHDHVGVLLDGARFAQVGELRVLVLALLDGAAELGERQHRHVQLFGKCLQAAGDLGDLLDAIVAAHAGAQAHELQVIDDDQAKAMDALEPPRPGPELACREGRRIVDEDG